MSYECPSERGFTIYSKSGCPNCKHSKTYLDSKFYTYKIVDCDDALVENREDFLLFLREHAQQEIKVFPVIFLDGKFIGSYAELKPAAEALEQQFEESFTF